jgi:hypothetical protein
LATVRAPHIERQRPFRETVECRADVLIRGVQPFEEESLDRTRAIQHLSQHPQQCDQIVATDPPVHHRPHGTRRSFRIETADEIGWARAQCGEENTNRIEDARDPAERQCRRTETGDLAVSGISKRPHLLDRIACGVLSVVIVIERIEPASELDVVSGASHRTRR